MNWSLKILAGIGALAILFMFVGIVYSPFLDVFMVAIISFCLYALSYLVLDLRKRHFSAAEFASSLTQSRKESKSIAKKVLYLSVLPLMAVGLSIFILQIVVVLASILGKTM